MSFSQDEIQAMAATAPAGSFLGETEANIAKWIDFVASAYDDPKDKHPLMFYGVTARILAKTIGSMSPGDFADAHMRTFILDMIKPGVTPFEEDADGEWKEEVILPAHVSACLRVQGKAAKLDTAPAASATDGAGGQSLAQAIASLTSAATAKEPKKDILSFDLKTRLREVGLSDFARELLPSEETLISLEKKAKNAKEKGRHFAPLHEHKKM